MRVSVYIVLFLVFMNGGAAMLEASGVADTMGIDPAEGNADRIETAQEQARDPNPGNGIGGTLFGMYNSLANTLETIYRVVFAGNAMLKAAGVPGFFVDFLFAGASLIVGMDTIAFFRGTEVV